MFDLALRPIKDRALGGAARWAAGRIAPGFVTAASLVACVGAGLAAAVQWPVFSVGLWLFGRVLDGLDGAIARAASTATDAGGYLDMLADTVGYAAVPIGVAAGSHDRHAWTFAALLLATFYVNSVSWMYLSALAEKRQAGASDRGESTSIHMPTGLIEGTETIVLFTVMLAVPDVAVDVFVLMAGLVGVTVCHRVVAARRLLR